MSDRESDWRRALYGPDGFFTRGERPSQHFRTAPLVGPELAFALLELLRRTDAALDRPPVLDFVDVGAGGGELSAAVRELASGDLARRLRVTAVDLGPARSLPGVRWRRELPAAVTGLLVGHEWLDAVPCPVVVGGSVLPPEQRAWLERWWPLRDGWTAEVGLPRDLAWADAVARVRGAALAVDYGHLRADRAAGRYPDGTLAGYRRGERVEPVLDGSCDVTAHVALDACAAAAGGAHVLVSQRDALEALGVRETPPPSGLAATDPHAWLDASARAGRAAELRAPGGLGSFGWLLHTSPGVPPPLPPLPPWRP
ncbi:SAM-dependent methyltransferase [Umezawaea beigongshangensis]|uniref:SAM-dependent methyltransferase n=1 Tax=Umezawaea beigongshangensis TaxID=2780383 RepID=UPI0018F22103|nr:SAM-dependent methyltransferase [Umezawaea beigongshangensis]